MSSTSPRRIRAAELRRDALELRRAGASIREIAATLSQRYGRRVAPSTVHKHLKAAREELQRQNADLAAFYVDEELDRLDRLLRAVWPRAVQTPPPGDHRAAYDHLRYVDRAVRILESRRRLLGLDAPEKIEYKGTLDGLLGALLAEPGAQDVNGTDELE